MIGDVSGKGIPAALYMAVTRTQVKTTALRGMPPAECFFEVTASWCRNGSTQCSPPLFGLFFRLTVGRVSLLLRRPQSPLSASSRGSCGENHHQ